VHHDPFACELHGRLEDGAHLHPVDLREGDRQAHAAVTEHRVELVKVLGPLDELLHRDAHRLREKLELLDLGRKKLVKRWVEEADGHRQAAHLAEDADEVLPLVRKELGERRRAPGRVVGQDHLAHGLDALLLEEHVLGAAQADPLGAEGAGRARVERGVGVGADLHGARGVGPRHELAELA
jgi:hypothetical protein